MTKANVTLNNEEWQRELDYLGPLATPEKLSMLVSQAGKDVQASDIYMVQGVIEDVSVNGELTF